MKARGRREVLVMGLVVRKNSELRRLYHRLSDGDLVAAVLRLDKGEEWIFLDLCSRGVTLFPSATSQLLSRSKAFQAQVFSPWMVPDTFVITGRRRLLAAMERYCAAGVGKVVTKSDRGDCGLGIHKWRSVEEVFNHASGPSLQYPFVLQPFVEDALDVRVVVIGGYLEAYWRKNPHSFRNNLHWGGESGRYELTSRQEALCREVMERGGFPYAHIDLLVTCEGETYLSEISLRGGLRGAAITAGEYAEKIRDVEESFVARFLAGGSHCESLHESSAL